MGERMPTGTVPGGQRQPAQTSWVLSVIARVGCEPRPCGPKGGFLSLRLLRSCLLLTRGRRREGRD